MLQITEGGRLSAQSQEQSQSAETQAAAQDPHKPLLTLRAVRACPARQAGAGPIRWVAGRMVVALTRHTALAIATGRAG